MTERIDHINKHMFTVLERWQRGELSTIEAVNIFSKRRGVLNFQQKLITVETERLTEEIIEFCEVALGIATARAKLAQEVEEYARAEN